MFKTVSNIVKESLKSEEWKKEILYPMHKWIFMVIWPYALGIICINFFLTIAAVSLVLYVYGRGAIKPPRAF